MGRLVLGLDIGITSVGYGVIDIDKYEFVDYGVRLFKEGTAADNETRRNTRGHRRLISRKATRINDMKHLLKSLGIINEDFHSLDNVYEIRVKGLKEKLSNDELATAILHITKRRGSTIETVDDTEEASKETGELKEILQANSKKLADDYSLEELQEAAEKISAAKYSTQLTGIALELAQRHKRWHKTIKLQNVIVPILMAIRNYARYKKADKEDGQDKAKLQKQLDEYKDEYYKDYDAYEKKRLQNLIPLELKERSR